MEKMSGPGSKTSSADLDDNRTYRHINRNQCKTQHSKHIPPFTPLRSIPKRKNETHQEQTNIAVIEDGADDGSPTKME